jgi:hypothetical protein
MFPRSGDANPTLQYRLKLRSKSISREGLKDEPQRAVNPALGEGSLRDIGLREEAEPVMMM